MIGIYVLLSTLALSGLLMTLTDRMEAQGRRVLETEKRHLLQAVSQILPSAEDSAVTQIEQWNSLLTCQGDSLMLLDADGNTLASAPATDRLPASVRNSIRRSVRHQGPVSVWPVSRENVLVCALQTGEDRPELLLLQSNVAFRQQASSAAVKSARRTASVAWLCGTACLAFVASTFVGPLRTLLRAMTTPESSEEHGDLLLRLGDRSDEFGQIAESVQAIDAERRIRLADLRTSEARIRALATRLSAVLQSMVEGVVAVDGDERILFANDVACRFMGLAASTVEGRLIQEAIRSPHVHETVREVIQEDEPSTLEFKLPRSDKVLSLVAAPIRHETSLGVVLVFHDVSEIRRLESMRRDFVSGVSHELKTPLTVIQACTDTLLDGAVDDPQAAQRFLKQIEEQSERLLQLILGMLQLARVESGEQALIREPVAVHHIAAQLVQALQPVADGRTIQLSVAGDSEMVVLADYQALQTVLSNLVDNGIKYTQDGGRVTLELMTEGGTRTIRVRDNGVGIPEKHRERVFERFYRVDRDRNRERGGTGLGLAIVKHLCNAMGAELELDSATGRGTTVTIRFPNAG